MQTNNINLISKYLDIIQDQQKIIDRDNKIMQSLRDKNKHLKSQAEQYRSSALEWKDKYDVATDIIKVYPEDVVKTAIIENLEGVTIKRALQIYQTMQDLA